MLPSLQQLHGFLIAGARRVVATNWVVDDQAGASLASYACSSIAKAEKAKQKIEYAVSLHEAKQWVRKQKKWESPFYWGSYVLCGAN